MNILLVLFIFIIIANLVIDTVIELLNLAAFSKDLPEEFHGFYDMEKYAVSQRYLEETTWLSLIKEWFLSLLLILFVVFGGLDVTDKFARSIIDIEVFSGIIFAFTLFFFYKLIEIPFSVFRVFVIEEKYGFNRATPELFIKDFFKEVGISFAVGAPIFAVLIIFFQLFGARGWLFSWLILVAFQLFFEFVAPVLILPMFNKFIPLEDGELKSELEQYAETQKFRMSGLYKMDASKRSSKSNAFFIGLGKFRRIVLFDTLIKNHTKEELVSVLAHEMGHYKLRHILKFNIISFLSSFLMFFVFSLLLNNSALFEAFKIENGSIYASFIIFGMLYSPINTLLSIGVNYLSRKFEFEADSFSVTTYKKPESMVLALKKLSIDNLSNLTPHPLKVFFEYSHPPVLERIKAIKNIAV